MKAVEGTVFSRLFRQYDLQSSEFTTPIELSRAPAGSTALR